MSAETTLHPTPEPVVIVKGSKERQSYNLNLVHEFLVAEGNATDAELEAALAYLKAAREGDGIIDADEAAKLENMLWSAFSKHGNELNVARLADVSGSEVARLEVDRINAKRQQAKRQHNGKK